MKYMPPHLNTKLRTTTDDCNAGTTPAGAYNCNWGSGVNW